uniref:Deltamethrin resistance protein prag01 domain-containing protein n=1 Tax=Ditylenchus dipsaci TaxID=166011 RepID=A0A915CXI5_9BILA
MLVTRVASRLAGLKNIFRQPKRAGHDVAHGGGHGHHAPFGPTVTYDYMPVPCKPHGVVYNQMQKKFNVFLGLSVLFTIASFAVCVQVDAFGMKTWNDPISFSEQRKSKV